ncbi:MAG: type II secretion system F family protein, partial [Candidatus Margulisbacteria bacterium]|nr:type II secretion system F family protein [Candidatus Margulisiibacteriota bacterium]
MSIRSDELVAFTEQFSNLIDAGIPLSNALAALEQQEENKEFKNILKQVFLDIDSGTTLSESLAKQPKVFSRFFVSMVYAGEQGAGLPKVLKRVAEYLEREA